MSEEIEKFDERGNLIYCRDFEGGEFWWEYDKNNNEIHYKNWVGQECWCEYNGLDRIIRYKYDNEVERYFRLDSSCNHIEIIQQEFEEIKFREKEQEFLSREFVSRFRLMEL